MPTSGIIQQQRQLVRILSDLDARHVRTEAEAEAQWRQVQQAVEQARTLLTRVGEQDLLKHPEPARGLSRPDADPQQAFSLALQATRQNLEALRTTLDASRAEWRQFANWQASKGFLKGVVLSVVFSPDSALLASANGDKTVKLWEVATGREVRNFSGHRRAPLSLCVDFSSDGKMLASGNEDKTINLWDVAKGRELRTLSGHKVSVAAVAFSPNGALLASGGWDKMVKLWDVETGRELRTLRGHSNLVYGVAFSPNGILLASGSADKTVKLWDVATGRELRTLNGHKGGMKSVAFSPDGVLVASGSDDKTIKLWEVATGRVLRTLSGHKGVVKSVAFSPDGALLASGSDDKTVKLWEVATGRELASKQPQVGKSISVAFSPTGRWLAAAGGNGYITVFQRDWPDLPNRVSALEQAAAECAFWLPRLREQIALKRQSLAQTQFLARYEHWATAFEQAGDWEAPTAFSWLNQRWEGWSPATTERPGTLLRLGRFLIDLKLPDQPAVDLPALLSWPGTQSLLFKFLGSARTAAVRATQSILLRLLAAKPPGKLLFTFIDPVGLGQNVAPFMSLADYDPQLVTARAWTEPRHIEQRLAELTEHIETVIQTYLRNEYANIEEYNQQAGEIAEPYRILVVFDFPANFSEDAARRLVSIAQNGPRCGVYTVVLADTSKPLPHGFDLADLERNATVVAWNGKRWVWEDDDFRDLALELDSPPPPELFSNIVKAVGEASLEAGNVEVPFERIAPPQEAWWQASSDEGVRVPLGPIGARKVQYLDLGQGTAQHALIAGRTGSGKSTLFHTLITDLALTYSPDEVALYLVDFKKGVEFKSYATHELPHARVVAIESEREFGLSVLQGLDVELKRRGDLFRAAGVDSIAEYREKNGSKMPRSLLIVDEFQEFFTEDDRVAAASSQVLDRLVRQGRAFGVHVILGSQTLAGAYVLSRSTMDQMAVRIALQCTEADSRLILADDNPAARLLSRPGEAIYNDANGLVEGNHPFQVAWLDDDEREEYLKRIHAFAEEQKYRPPQPQIVFEGNAPADIRKNRALTDLLDAPAWPAPSRRISAWLGEPIAIAAHTAAHFRRQSASNLLIVGRDDEAAMGMMSAALMSLAAQQAPHAARFYVLDFSSVDASYADLLSRLIQGLPHPVQRGRRRQLPGIIAAVAAEVERRLDLDESLLGQEPTIYLLIYGLQRARDLRQEDDPGFSFGADAEEAPPSPAKQFPTILQEGPDLGIHTIAWCDTTTNLTRTLDRRSLREFEMRVAMQMGAEDSANLIDTPAAGKLGLYRAYFYSEDEARLEKFRPYGLPDSSWLQTVAKNLTERTGNK